MKKIMIVEDSSLMIAVISNFIKKEDFGEIEIITARNGKEAIEVYSQQKPDLVFMDIKMPVMDGITSLEEIKKIDPEAKVVICTSLKEADQEAKAKKLGVVDYIMKPFGKQDIIDTLRKNL